MDQLSELAKKLGARAAERIDVDQTTRSVLARLREPVTERPWWTKPAWLRSAAAVVVLLGGGVAIRQVRQLPAGDHRGVAAHVIADDLSDLSTTELQDVLASMDQMLDSTAAPAGSADLNELDAQQLRDVLRSLEG